MNVPIMASIRSFLSKASLYVAKHKIRSAIIAIIVIGAGYWLYGVTHPMVVQSKYVLATVQTGTIISTVSGSGQVSPSNQITINPKATGQISRVFVTNGAQVKTGQVLGYISAADQYNALQNAQASLKSAQISLQKIQQPATALQLTQDQNAVAKANASIVTDQTNLSTVYGTSYSDVISAFLDIPNVQTQLQDVVIGTGASRGSLWNIDYYQSALQNWDNFGAQSYRTNTYNAYLAAQTAYNSAYADFQLTSQSSSTSTIESILNESYTLVQAEQNALNTANSFLQYYENQVKAHNQNPNTQADTSLASLSTNIAKINTHLSALLSDRNQLASTKQAIINDTAAASESTQTLAQLQAGANTLDLQSAELSVQQQQNAVDQAQTNLSNYTIVAPFSGIIANLNLHVGDTVTTGTSVATLITDQDLAVLSLNEVDAAKVAVGQQATLSFDAIPNLSLTGQVVDVSPLGTVTQGVVSYSIKIGFATQDSRVKAGMTVNATVQTAVHQNVLTVPASSITTLAGATYVRAFSPAVTGVNLTSTAGVTSTTPPINIPVTIGLSDNTNTEIVSGLTDGEQIVSRTISGSSAKTTAATATSRTGGGGPGGGTSIRL